MKLSKIILALVLIFTTLAMTSCSVSQFDAVLNEIGPAITTIIEIVAIVKGVPANTAVASKVSADVAAIEKLQTDLQSAEAASKPGIEASLNVGFSVLNSDLGSVFAVAQVSDQNTQAKITALVGLVETAVTIAEAAIPSSAVKLGKKAPNLTASALIDSWNHVLVAKTGNSAVDAYTGKHKLHKHGKFLRVASAGVLN